MTDGKNPLRAGLPQDWAREFNEFLNAPPLAPSARVNEAILGAVHRDLNPSLLKVFTQATLIQVVVGFSTLLFCPQFGIHIGDGMGLMAIFMRFGETACMAACGAVFLGSSSLVMALTLRAEVLRQIRRHRALQLALMLTLSFGAFICFGEVAVGGLTMAWVMGAALGGFATLELGWLVRRLARAA